MKQTFARNIVRTQRTFGLNNTDMAYVLDISRRTLGRIKNEATYPSPYSPSETTIEKVANTFGVEPTEVTSRLPAAVINSVL